MAAGYRTFRDALAAAQREANRTGAPCPVKRTRSIKTPYAIGDGRYGIQRVKLVSPHAR